MWEQNAVGKNGTDLLDAVTTKLAFVNTAAAKSTTKQGMPINVKDVLSSWIMLLKMYASPELAYNST